MRGIDPIWLQDIAALVHDGGDPIPFHADRDIAMKLD
jgi:hypothetical protein